MEEVIKIEGGHKLNGTIRINGAKNATVALIPALVLCDDVVTLDGVPKISDVEALADLLHELGAKVNLKDDQFQVDPRSINNIPLDSEAVNKLRASYYFMGSLLGKYKKVTMKMPGGCYLGPRPIDLHLKGFEALGAKIEYINDTYYLEAENLKGAKIYLDFASVGATINIMLAASRAQGKTTIENAAKEPEIIDVANLINKMGGKIKGAGTDVITITGVDHMHGCYHEIIPDRIEAGTYIILAAAAGEVVKIDNVIPLHLESLTSKLLEMGVDLEIDVDSITIRGGKPLKAIKVRTQVYPGLATDLQQPLTTLLTQAVGESYVKENIYPERFKHCGQLNKMGANIAVEEPRCYVSGPTPLKGTEVSATDLRCGAALVIAGLIADGVTQIDNIYHIDRGYANIDEYLQALGAKIWREKIW